MRLTRGPRRTIKPPSDRPRTAEEVRIWSTFRAFKAGLTGEKGENLVMAALAELGVPALHDVILRDNRGLTQIDCQSALNSFQGTASKSFQVISGSWAVGCGV